MTKKYTYLLDVIYYRTKERLHILKYADSIAEIDSFLVDRFRNDSNCWGVGYITEGLSNPLSLDVVPDDYCTFQKDEDGWRVSHLETEDEDSPYAYDAQDGRNALINKFLKDKDSGKVTIQYVL